LGVTVTIRGTDKTMAAFTQLWERLGQSITPTAQLFIRWNLLPSLIKEIKDNDLFVLVGARKGAVSHRPAIDAFPEIVGHHGSDINLLLIYPGRESFTELDFDV
ncbi:MAG: hypothetical protein AB7F75_08940, partial [Planctomycetota bacterium]